MKLKLNRKFKGENYTIGDLYIDGGFFCNTIEDKVRDLPLSCSRTEKYLPCTCSEKVYAETAIPPGIYKIIMEYSQRFKKVLPSLQKVPHFLGILIHSGNTEKDSAGCIIVGRNTVKGMVTDSRATLNALLEKLSGQDEITIEII